MINPLHWLEMCDEPYAGQILEHIASLEAKLAIWEEAYRKCEEALHEVLEPGIKVWRIIKEAHAATREDKR